MFTMKLLFFLFFGIFAGLVASSPLEGTNAARLARGLPPKPPKNLFIDGTKGPTPRLGARWATTSSLPTVTLNGRLQLRKCDDKSVVGNVRNLPGDGTISGINLLGPDNDLLVTLSYDPAHPHKINILATNPAFPAPFYVGAGTSSTSSVPNLSPNQQDTVPFTNVELTPGDARPTIPPTRQVYVESAIWSLDKDTNELKARWINADGSRPKTAIAYDSQQNAIFFVGDNDKDKHNRDNNSPVSAVELFIVPV